MGQWKINYRLRTTSPVLRMSNRVKAKYKVDRIPTKLLYKSLEQVYSPHFLFGKNIC